MALRWVKNSFNNYRILEDDRFPVKASIYHDKKKGRYYVEVQGPERISFDGLSFLAGFKHKKALKSLKEAKKVATKLWIAQLEKRIKKDKQGCAEANSILSKL